MSAAPFSRDARNEARAGLYVHVPFCATRCSYCDFSSGALSAAALERYLAALEREIARRAPQAAGLEFHSVFFGGGTPSALSARHFERVWRALSARFAIKRGAEITLEANPESVRPALLDAWARAGVNRLSFGAQSFVPEELAALGRIHSAARPAEAMALARAHGFLRLSLDLMFGFPGHTLEHWRRTVDAALALEPGHLSAYCFIPEPGTPLGAAVLRGEQALPRGDEQAECYEALARWIAPGGYAAYETSNFCRPGEEARHNLVYWLRRPYLGLGPSAHGLVHGVRYGNHYALERWAAALEAGAPCEAEREEESDRTIALEVVMLGLRLSDGIDRRDYDARTWRAVEGRYGAALDLALAAGRLEPTAHGVRIPGRFAFVADDVIAWIEARADRARWAPDPAVRGLTVAATAP
ncbi:MAG TPA: radical SAM family heme chaperone HemW [Candidatus Eisenbacteria bacterium]|jgi:oxygen-independent coproporphyrinogen-3 oxidase